MAGKPHLYCPNFKAFLWFIQNEVIKKSSSFNSGKIKNLAKYLIFALKEDYQLAKSSLKINEIQKIEEKRKSLDQIKFLECKKDE